ncbi:ATP-binding cassette domain-containing protein [bacterium]|nr:ATP-binding cassette domain-containing protein [bacterium]
MKLKIEHISFHYPDITGDERDVLDGINLEIGENELVGIVGRSGSGKTTLIQHFNGLLLPSSGKIALDNLTYGTDKSVMREVRRKIGLAFQFPESQFFEETVRKEIAFGIQRLEITDTQKDERVKWAMEMAGLDYQKMASRNPHFLSEGEKRRVGIASVLVMQPWLVILDEPTAGLDWKGQQQLKKLIRHYVNQGRSLVVVSHHLEILFDLVERIIVLFQGKIVFDGSRLELLSRVSDLAQWGLEAPAFFHYRPVVEKILQKDLSEVVSVADFFHKFPDSFLPISD